MRTYLMENDIFSAVLTQSNREMQNRDVTDTKYWYVKAFVHKYCLQKCVLVIRYRVIISVTISLAFLSTRYIWLVWLGLTWTSVPTSVTKNTEGALQSELHIENCLNTSASYAASHLPSLLLLPAASSEMIVRLQEAHCSLTIALSTWYKIRY